MRATKFVLVARILILVVIGNPSSPVGSNNTNAIAQVITGSGRTSSSVFSKGNDEWDIVLNPADRWFDTNARVMRGSILNISATGRVTWTNDAGANGTVGPQGASYTADRLANSSDFPLPSAPCGSLVMKIGSVLYAVGSGGFITVEETGAIQLMVNDRYQYLFDNTGSFTIRAKVARIIERKEAYGFSFDLLEAKMIAGQVICYLIVTSVSQDREVRTFAFEEDCKMTDSLGNRYGCGLITFANQEWHAELVANTPTFSTVMFKDVRSGATKISLLEFVIYLRDDKFSVSFRNVPITR